MRASLWCCWPGSSFSVRARVLRLTALPVAFLLFMVPLPISSMTHSLPLKLLVAKYRC